MNEINNWFQDFLNACCDINKNYISKSGQLYIEYRAFCLRAGEFPKSTKVFYRELDSRNFKRKRTSKGSFIKGLKLKNPS